MDKCLLVPVNLNLYYQVDELMKEVAEENGLDIAEKLKDVTIGSGETTVEEDAELTKRSVHHHQCLYAYMSLSMNSDSVCMCTYVGVCVLVYMCVCDHVCMCVYVHVDDKDSLE